MADRFRLTIVIGPESSWSRNGKSRDNLRIDYVNRDACKPCGMLDRSTKSFRRVSRVENEAVLDLTPRRLADWPDVLYRRRNSVEP